MTTALQSAQNPLFFQITQRPWLVNTLLDDVYLNQKAQELSQLSTSSILLDWLKTHFDPEKLKTRNEAQLEKHFIDPLLTFLGWNTSAYQVAFNIQGKLVKPDYCLVTKSEQIDHLLNTKAPATITTICESKVWNKTLDTGKADRDTNPHHQLQDYLSTLRVRFGFLTNGNQWRIYDTDKITAKKTFIEFNLTELLAEPNSQYQLQGLALFAFLFGQSTYIADESAAKPTAIEATITASQNFTLEVEENLKAVIYGYAGEESLFELMGYALHKANPKASLTTIYENSVILLFRLLFIVYFEDKNRELLATHPFYQNYSLEQLFNKLHHYSAEQLQAYDGIYALKQLFEMLDQGAEDIDIPLFNGGLFDPQRAPLLLTPKIFSNGTLLKVLEKLLYKSKRGTTLFDIRRDFKNMSVTHLGRIYEGLLEFCFEYAPDDAIYLEYESTSTKGKTVEAYYDTYDLAKLRKEKGFKSLRENVVHKGEMYLKSASNSRKATASYYTPPSLSQPLVKLAIDQALANQNSGKALMDLKILDNACGSGHFLVETLGYLTDLALARLEQDADLKKLVKEERSKIVKQLKFLNLAYEPEDAQILKRALLKRCIFGVDLNPFAVELARLSLWMDSFIFGTPLSFIEHHIQQGNALMGATIQEFIDYNAAETLQNDLFVDNFGARFDELRGVMQELDAMRDTTADEVERSKKLWKQQIEPKLRLLARALSFITTRRALIAEGDHQAAALLDKSQGLVSQLFDEAKSKSTIVKQIEAYTAKYSFFHYEVAFPEAFAGQQQGFDVIVGNPPWDKTKFADTDFFPQYHSNYRTLKNSEKAEVQQRLLEVPAIQQHYESTKLLVEVTNNYYKTHYPLNKGSGDGNLFRFFVERNLGLLAKKGSLNYVLPSALMFEEGSTQLRHYIFKYCHMPVFWSFENNKGIFPDVHRSYKFAIIQIVNKPAENTNEEIIDSAFYILDPLELNESDRHIPYSLTMVKQLSPQYLSLMELRHINDLSTLSKCYAAFSTLLPEWLDFRNELHLTADKHLFIEQYKAGLIPLVEGKMINQFNHKFSEPSYWLDPHAVDNALQSKEIYRMAQDLKTNKAEAAQYTSAIRYDREFIRLGFRDIARDTDERTLIFSLIPKNSGVGNTINISIPKTYELNKKGEVIIKSTAYLRLLLALAWFNSLVVDWMARFMIQIHANKTYLYRLPIPQPSDTEILENPDYYTLAKNALLLSLMASWEDFAELAPLFNLTPQDVPKTDKARDKLRAENDKIIATLYGITTQEFTHLLQSFKVLQNKHPEYLTLLN